MSLSALGLGSNLEVNGLVSQLMAIERQPLAVSQQREAKVQAQLSAYGRLQSQIALFGDAAESLAKPGKLAVYNAAIADGEVARVSAGNAAVAGNYSLEVRRLAKVDKLASSAFANPGSAVGTGSLTISLGSFASVDRKFTPRADKPAVTVNVNAGNNTLADIRDAINAAQNGASGVHASIDTDGGGARLIITGTDTGAGNAIKIDAPGLAAFAFDPAEAGTQAVSRLQAAQDAIVRIDNHDIVSPSNRITGAIEGLTLNLEKAKPGLQTTVTVVQDKAASIQALREFVASYNTLSTLARSYTKYDVATKIKGPLQGEATAVSVVNELHTTVAGAIPAPAGDFTSLSEIGITLQADGSLKLDESKLAAATAGESGIGKLTRLFAATASNPDSFVTRIKAFVDKTQGSQGLIFWTTKGLSTTIQRLDKEQQNINRRLVGVEAYLREQFNTLDSRRGLHDAAEAYSANQNTIWSNNSK